MVNDSILVAEVQNVLSNFPMQIAGDDISHLMGEVDGRRVEVLIPAAFPEAAPVIRVEGNEAYFQYIKGMSIVECIKAALQQSMSQFNQPYASQTGYVSQEDRLMDEVQNVLSRHPGFQPVNGDLRHLRGVVLTSMGYVTMEVTIPANYPFQDAVFTFDKDVGFGRTVNSSMFGVKIADAIDALKQKMSFQAAQPALAQQTGYAHPQPFPQTSTQQIPNPTSPPVHTQSRNQMWAMVQVGLGIAALLFSIVKYAEGGLLYGTTGIVGLISLIRGLLALSSSAKGLAGRGTSTSSYGADKALYAPYPSTMNYAGFGIRLGAVIVDGLIFIILNTILAFLELGVILSWIIYIAYETGFIASKSATPGKMAFGLKVVSEDGSNVDGGKALIRTLVKAFLGWITWIGILTDGKKRSWHDRAAGTVVVRG